MLKRGPATDRIIRVMMHGSSITWREALQIITGIL